MLSNFQVQSASQKGWLNLQSYVASAYNQNRPIEDTNTQESYTLSDDMQPTKSQAQGGYGSVSAEANENPFQAAARARASKAQGADGWDNDGWGESDGWGANDDWGSNDSWGNESSTKSRASVTRKKGDWLL